jgi:hypothetical protein
MRERTWKKDGVLPTGGMTRRKFLEARAACVAPPWMFAPVGAQGAGVAQSLPTLPDSARRWLYWWWLDSTAKKASRAILERCRVKASWAPWSLTPVEVRTCTATT